ncbi:hypothetical protein CC78DRAFT_574967 [Lojkania enalia]|uniref:Uncharacterized protein n=1 Tax=Lojkania enalia TaxID=147567 RepID=A0A9P4TNE9_9PLEO|nr:hypothetical protein CC78DRAFT_574967 [Didymosphaeria enalia]
MGPEVGMFPAIVAGPRNGRTNAQYEPRGRRRLKDAEISPGTTTDRFRGPEMLRRPFLSSAPRSPSSLLVKLPRRPYASQTPPPPPPPPSSPSRIARFNRRLPIFLHKYTNALAGAPLAHVTSFLLLHEITAVVPLLGLAATFHYTHWLPSWFAEGAWVLQGVERFGKYFRRKGWIGSEEATEAEREAQAEMSRRDTAWRVGEGGVRLVVEFATAYAVTKVLLPVRVLRYSIPLPTTRTISRYSFAFRVVFSLHHATLTYTPSPDKMCGPPKNRHVVTETVYDDDTARFRYRYNRTHYRSGGRCHSKSRALPYALLFILTHRLQFLCCPSTHCSITPLPSQASSLSPSSSSSILLHSIRPPLHLDNMVNGQPQVRYEYTYVPRAGRGQYVPAGIVNNGAATPIAPAAVPVGYQCQPQQYYYPTNCTPFSYPSCLSSSQYAYASHPSQSYYYSGASTPAYCFPHDDTPKYYYPRSPSYPYYKAPYYPRSPSYYARSPYYYSSSSPYYYPNDWRQRYYGRSYSSIPSSWYCRHSSHEWDDRMRATTGGAYDPKRIKPADALPDDPFWVRERDGTWTLRPYYSIEAECYPGRWTMNAEKGYLVFERN